MSRNLDQNNMLKIRNEIPRCLETLAPPTRSSPTSVQARAALVETEFKINITEQRSNQTSGLHFHNCLLKQYLDYGTWERSGASCHSRRFVVLIMMMIIRMEMLSTKKWNWSILVRIFFLFHLSVFYHLDVDVEWAGCRLVGHWTTCPGHGEYDGVKVIVGRWSQRNNNVLGWRWLTGTG